jgi:hypothetical protein
VIWTRGAAYRLIGDSPQNWSFHKWLDHGCVAHRTVCSHKNFLIWLGPDGVYAAEGSGSAVAVQRISEPIRNAMEAMTAANQANAHAFVWNDRYYLCFPTVAYYFDLRYRAWGKLTSWLWRDSTVSQNTGAAVEMVYGAQYGVARAWQLETGTSDNGTAIAVRWVSRDKDMGQFARDKRIHRVIAAFKASTGTVTVTLYRGAGESIQTFSHDLATVRRTGANISILDDRANEYARDEYFRMEVSSSTTGEFRMLQAGTHYTLAT